MRPTGLLVLMLAAALAAGGQDRSRPQQTILSDSSHFIAYEVRGNSVIFTLEMIADLSDETASDNGGRLGDFTDITFDKNLNNVIDKRVDIGYAVLPRGKSVCPFYLHDGFSISRCGILPSRASLKVEFRGTANEATPHPVYRYSIPRSELVDGEGKIGVVFRFHSAGKGYFRYPRTQDSEPYNSFKDSHILEL